MAVGTATYQMPVLFGPYFAEPVNLGLMTVEGPSFWAITIVVVLTALNHIGVVLSGRVQLVLTVVPLAVLLLVSLFVVGDVGTVQVGGGGQRRARRGAAALVHHEGLAGEQGGADEIAAGQAVITESQFVTGLFATVDQMVHTQQAIVQERHMISHNSLLLQKLALLQGANGEVICAEFPCFAGECRQQGQIIGAYTFELWR